MSFLSRVSALQRRALIPALVLGVAALIVAPLPGQDTTLAARSRGAKNAPVTVYEMADFQCPYCRDFAVQTMPALLKEYVNTGKVRWVFINLPIPSLHANAEAAAEYAACASREDKFWPAHDMLYQTQQKWEQLRDPAPFFISQMLPLGLDPKKMQQCLSSGTGAAVVRDDVAGSQKAGASSTPSFYIEGGLMAGSRPVAVFEHVIDSIYKVKTAHAKN